MKKRLLILLTIALLVCIGSITWALTSKVPLVKNDIAFSTPEETINYIFKQWDFKFQGQGIDYETNSDIAPPMKLSDEYLKAFSQRQQSNFYFHNTDYRYLIPDHECAKVKLISIEETPFGQTSMLEYFKDNAKEKNMISLTIKYSGVSVSSNNPDDYIERQFLCILVKQDNSWLIETFG